MKYRWLTKRFIIYFSTMAIDPVQLALLTAKKATPASNKVGAGSVSTPPTVKPSLNLNQWWLQAVSTAMNTANTINNTPKPVIAPEKIPQTGSFELWELSPDEVAFAKKAKQAWYSLEDTKTSIAKRRWVATPTTTQNIAWWLLDTAKKVWWSVLSAVTWLSGIYGAWAAAQYVWKKLYWMTLPPTQKEAEALQSFAAWTSNFKPKTAVETALEAPILSWNPLKSKSYWMLWTRSWIWIQAEAKANDIFKNTIQPILNKAKTSNTVVNVQGAIQELWSDILKLAKGDPDKLAEYTEAFKQLQSSFKGNEFKNMTLDKLQELKSWLQERTPQKYFKGKEITNAYWELRAKLSTKLTWKLHSAIKKDFWTQSAELYKDYANMKGMSEIWPKARTMGWLKWWFWGFWSTLSDTALTPVTTTTGKILYKAWWVAKALPASLLKWVTKWLKSIVKSWSIFTVLSDWTLIPWSPSNLANIAMSTPKEDRITIKWSDMRIHKDQFKYDKNLKMNVAQTDLWLIDENWNIIN